VPGISGGLQKKRAPERVQRKWEHFRGSNALQLNVVEHDSGFGLWRTAAIVLYGAL